MNAGFKAVVAVFLALGLSACGGGDDDEDAAGSGNVLIQFSSVSSNAGEASGTANITLSISPAATRAISLPYSVAGTAGATDRTVPASPLNIPAGATSATIRVTIADDALVEASETVVLGLELAPEGVNLGSNLQHTLTITDNDSGGGGSTGVRFSAASSSAAENAGTINVVVNVTPAPATALSVPFTVSGTATAADRGVSASPLTIAAGATSGNIVVTVTDDASMEGNETVVLTLSAPSGATLGTPSTHTLTLLDNDGSSGPVVSFSSASQAALESAGTVNVNLTISPVSATPITLPYTVSGTALPADRTVPASPLTIPAGTSNASIPVTINNDNGAEGSETVVITLGAPTGATLGPNTTHTLNINDDEGAPQPQGMIFAVDDTLRLLRFRATTPGTVTTLNITGIENGPGGFALPTAALDFRPATGELFLLVEDRKLYTINTTTGAATKVGQVNAATVPGELIAMDFNPCVDKIRAIGDGRQNYRLNPDATLLARDTDLAFAAGDANAGATPGVDGAGYTACTLSGTTLFAIDSLNDLLLRIGSVGANPTSPNSGQLSTVGPLGVSLGGANQLPFDINTVINVGFTADNDGNDSTLYGINLDSGNAVNLGRIGDGSSDIRVLGLAVQP